MLAYILKSKLTDFFFTKGLFLSRKVIFSLENSKILNWELKKSWEVELGITFLLMCLDLMLHLLRWSKPSGNQG